MSHPRIVQIARLTCTVTLLVGLSSCAAFKKKPKYAGSADGDFVNGSPLPERQDGVSFLGNDVDKNRFSPVYFAFDSDEIAPSETSKLGAVADYLRSSSKQLIIAGFTDERGTAEYNRGLGEKRAQAVRSYLLEQGADTDRIQTTSFGAEMPADPGHNEAAWAKNRRAEFGFTR